MTTTGICAATVDFWRATRNSHQICGYFLKPLPAPLPNARHARDPLLGRLNHIFEVRTESLDLEAQDFAIALDYGLGSLTVG